MPDFIIVGAMKSGTTTLHALLDQDPRVFIPPGEIGFFDYDDYFEHPDFSSDAASRWLARDFDAAPAAALEWYRAFFAPAPAGSVRGEDSTTYLAAARAPGRIAGLIPGARLIVMLRDPTARAYSQYWHLLRSGRVQHAFEDAVRLMPERILGRSLYLPQVRRYLEVFPREQIHFVLFEHFIRDLAGSLSAVKRFLDLAPDVRYDRVDAQMHRNPALVPRWQRLQRLRNRWLWRKDFARYVSHLRTLPPAPGSARVSRWAAWADAIHARLNPLRVGKPPALSAATRTFLNALFRKENRGLDGLVGMDLDAVWYRDV